MRQDEASRARSIAREPQGGVRALVFDVDGTLADTEREGHLAACNAAFAEGGFPIRWSWEEYQELLSLPGNQNRMRLALTRLGTLSPAEVDAAAEELFRIKQARYLERVPGLRLRPGVERLVAEAFERGVRLAIVSTSSEPQIHALLQHLLPRYEYAFAPVLGQQSGRKVGHDGRLYERCVDELGLPREGVLVIEDAEDGFRAALRAGLACVVVPNDYTRGDFTGAALVVESLERVTLDDLDEVLTAEAGRSA
jgi:beta-phosphoglucomutase-like phosphatase (HAD superfamily)